MSQEEPPEIPVITVIDLIKELSKYPSQTEVLLAGEAYHQHCSIGIWLYFAEKSPPIIERSLL